MKHVKTLTFGQQVQLFTLSKGLVDRINDKMDKEIKNKTFVDAKDSLSAKITSEYRIREWLQEVDIDRELASAVSTTYNNANFEPSFQLEAFHINDAWVNDQREGEYQVMHRHSGETEIGFTSVLFLQVPDFGEEYTNTALPHNGRLTLSGNCGGLFSIKHHLVDPVVGDFYVFPYDLEHLVYPFRGPGVRRSMSVNFDMITKKKPALIYKKTLDERIEKTLNDNIQKD